ncbi:MAG: HepT-like ribonuclease domain-containing protein [Methanospirillum sp.]
MSRSPLLYCDDILDAIETVRDYVRGIAFEECADDPMRADAVPSRLVIVGEAVGQIPKAVREPGGTSRGADHRGPAPVVPTRAQRGGEGLRPWHPTR